MLLPVVEDSQDFDLDVCVATDKFFVFWQVASMLHAMLKLHESFL